MADRWIKKEPKRTCSSKYLGAQYFEYMGKIFKVCQFPESKTFYLEWEPGGINELETRLDDNCPICGHRMHYRGCRIPGNFNGGGIGHAKAFLKKRMKREVRIARLLALDVKVYNFTGREITPSLDEDRIDPWHVPGWAEVSPA